MFTCSSGHLAGYSSARWARVRSVMEDIETGARPGVAAIPVSSGEPTSIRPAEATLPAARGRVPPRRPPNQTKPGTKWTPLVQRLPFLLRLVVAIVVSPILMFLGMLSALSLLAVAVATLMRRACFGYTPPEESMPFPKPGVAEAA